MDQQQIMEILAKILESQNEFRQSQDSMSREINAMSQDFNSKQDSMSQDINAMNLDFNSKHDSISRDFNSKLHSMSNTLEKLALSIEHDIIVKISALYDSREVQKDHNARVDETLDRIEKKVEVLQLETSSLRRIK